MGLPVGGTPRTGTVNVQAQLRRVDAGDGLHIGVGGAGGCGGGGGTGDTGGGGGPLRRGMFVRREQEQEQRHTDEEAGADGSRRGLAAFAVTVRCLVRASHVAAALIPMVWVAGKPVHRTSRTGLVQICITHIMHGQQQQQMPHSVLSCVQTVQRCPATFSVASQLHAAWHFSTSNTHMMAAGGGGGGGFE